jgi:mannose-6-phosphate isomerase
MKVEKPWGHEIRWAITEDYLGKIIHIESGHRLSRQYHQMKDESIYVLEGTLVLELHQGKHLEKVVLKPGASWRIYPHVVHRFCAPSEGCTLVEVSTAHIDDVIRLEDDYNRKESQ